MIATMCIVNYRYIYLYSVTFTEFGKYLFYYYDFNNVFIITTINTFMLNKLEFKSSNILLT